MCLQSPDICNLLGPNVYCLRSILVICFFFTPTIQQCRLKFEVTLCAYFAFPLFAARLFCPRRPYLPTADPLLLSRLPTSDISLLSMQIFLCFVIIFVYLLLFSYSFLWVLPVLLPFSVFFGFPPSLLMLIL